MSTARFENRAAWLLTPLGCAVVVALLLTGFNLVYFLFPAEPSLVAAVIFSYAMPVTLVAWMTTDAHHRRSTPCFDFGTFALFTFPISLVCYCCASRGWRGLLLSIGLCSLVVLPTVIAGAIALPVIFAREVATSLAAR